MGSIKVLSASPWVASKQIDSVCDMTSGPHVPYLLPVGHTRAGKNIITAESKILVINSQAFVQSSEVLKEGTHVLTAQTNIDRPAHLADAMHRQLGHANINLQNSKDVGEES